MFYFDSADPDKTASTACDNPDIDTVNDHVVLNNVTYTDVNTSQRNAVSTSLKSEKNDM